MAANLPIALVDPQPRSLDMIFLPHELEELRGMVQLLPREARKPSPAEIGEILQQATFVIGQTDMPKERLAVSAEPPRDFQC